MRIIDDSVSIIGGMAIAVVLGLVPVTLAHHGSTVSLNRACAAGTCCPESESICNAGGGDELDYYFKAGGSCRGIGG